MNKLTLVIGANTRTNSYANMAVSRLLQNNIDVIALGINQGKIENIEITTEFPKDKNIDTVTLYINPKRQEEYYEKIIGLKPKRVIFNPGTENPEFKNLLIKNNISVLEQCTLVMLSLGEY
ncbi:MAG: CoA-binding protein [Bacteroidales bacterium]|jgi:predicted CoA-binding protein|nr:CoA-binding protein [Bacteroidales bacterium]